MVFGPVAALWPAKLASVFLGPPGHDLLFLVVVLTLSAVLIAVHEFLRR